MHNIIAFFPHWLDPVSWPWLNPKAYALVSGPLGDAVFVSMPLVAWHFLNCGAPGCKRIGVHHFQDPDTKETHKLCSKHHPCSKGKVHWWSHYRVHDLEHIHAQYHKSLRQGATVTDTADPPKENHA